MTDSMSSNQKGLTIKDLVTTGIFTALFFLFCVIGGAPFAPNPVLTFYMPIGSALLCGPIFLLLTAKVPKRGPISILGFIVGLIWFATGMHWAFDLGYLLMGVVADFVAGLRRNRSVHMNIFAYMLFCLGPTAAYIMFFIDPAGWASTMLKNGTDPSYIDAMAAAATYWILPIILIGTLLAAGISGFIGKKLLNKQFKKAGITA